MRLSQPEETSREEWIGIIFFSATMIITLNFAIAMAVSFSTIFLYFLFSSISKKYLIRDEKITTTLSSFSKGLMLLLFGLYAIDTFLTWKGVIDLQVARETNHLLSTLWNSYGYHIGQLIHLIIFSATLLILNFLITRKSKFSVTFGFTFILISCVVWILAIANNLVVLWICYA